MGLIAVLSTCATAGFAGVYFEMMLKDGSSTPFWVRNLQMYSCGVVSALLGILVSDWERIRNTDFLHGYTTQVWFIIGAFGFRTRSGVTLMFKPLTTAFQDS